MKVRKSFCNLKQLIAYLFFVIPSISLFANAPENLLGKKLILKGTVSELNLAIENHFYFTNSVNQVGHYNVGQNDEDWSLERYHFAKQNDSYAELIIINHSGEQAKLILQFSSSTMGTLTGSYYNVNDELQWSSLSGSFSINDLDESIVPDNEKSNSPDGYYAPASIAGGTLSAQDQYWSIYDESVSFSSTGTFSASITNDSGTLSGSGSSHTFTKTGTNSATLTYTIDGTGYVFEYDFQFTGENAGIYTKYADYGGGTTDVTTGPFSLSGVAVPQQFAWEDYEDFSGSTLDTTKWDLSQWDGGIVPALEGSRLKFSGQANSSSSVNIATSAMLGSSSNVSVGSSSSTSPHSILEFKDSLNLKGIELTFSIPSGVPNQMGFGLYAIAYQTMLSSGGDSEESAIRFNFDLWADNSLAATLEFDAKDPTTGIEQGIDKSISFDSSYRVSFIRGDSQISFYMDGELVGEFPYSDVGEYFIVRAMNEINQPFTTYLDNVRVLRRSTTTTQPDPLTVVSDPNGQAVVVQVGNEYQWNSTLDGVTLWSVSASERDAKWSPLTAKFSGGNVLYGFEFKDDVADTGNNKVTYQIDENGYIKSLENDGGYQYYHVVSVENGIIATLEGDEQGVVDDGVNVADQWFFTTRAAAEEYYYSKVNPKDWMWFDQYPWVYSNEMQEWLYFYPSGGTLMYWSNKGQAWRQFN